MTVQTLVDLFAASVIGQAEAMRQANAMAGSRHADALLAAFDGLRAAGDIGREALVALLKHDDANVRIQAAACLLRYCHNKARAVLETEAKASGALAFVAAQALQRWDEGTWELDPED